MDTEIATRIADRLLILRKGLKAQTKQDYTRGQLQDIVEDLLADRYQNTLDKTTHQVTLSFDLASPEESRSEAV